MSEQVLRETPRVEFDSAVPLTSYDNLFDNVTEFLPYLSRNDLDLVFDYMLDNAPSRLQLKAAWDQASACGETEVFLSALCGVVARRGHSIRLVRTKEDGTKIVKDLKNGFVTLVFDNCI